MPKDKEIKVRIRHIIAEDVVGRTASELARRIGVKPTYLATILSDKNKGVSATVYKGFLAAGVNLNWLISGEGPMFVSVDIENAIRTVDIENAIRTSEIWVKLPKGVSWMKEKQ